VRCGVRCKPLPEYRPVYLDKTPALA